MKAHHILTVVLCFFALTGCEQISRNCDGFHHPAAEIWTGNDGLGEVRSFVDSAGNQRIYSLQSIDKEGPSVAKGRGSDSNVVECLETAKYLYVQSTADIAYEFDFLQRDIRADLATEDQSVRLVVRTQNPVGVNTDIITRRWFRLTDIELNTTPAPPEGTTWPSDLKYFAEATIGGKVYVDLVEYTFIDNSERFTSGLIDQEAQWVRVLVARDVGLLQYELLNGTVYTLNTE